MNSLADLWIWDDPQLTDRLRWYVYVADNRRPGKFRIAATIPVAEPEGWLETAPEETLWVELERLTSQFVGRLDGIRAGAPLPSACQGPSLLDLLSALARL